MDSDGLTTTDDGMGVSFVRRQIEQSRATRARLDQMGHAAGPFLSRSEMSRQLEKERAARKAAEAELQEARRVFAAGVPSLDALLVEPDIDGAERATDGTEPAIDRTAARHVNGALAAAVRVAGEEVDAAAAEWSIDTWIGSLDVVQLLARCLSAPLEHPSSLAAAASASKRAAARGDVQLAFVKALGGVGPSHAAVRSLLLDGGIIDVLARELTDGAARLHSAAAATSQQLNSKFMSDESGFTLTYGGLSTFFGGLCVMRSRSRDLCIVPCPSVLALTQRSHDRDLPA